ncbi:flagellar hook-basal body complex protein FliE [Petroclostridium sp. X23]|jgi:flagellar hook-basal body complex protein FliE|uniref:flagellar hook-basal body complex protein FliE n=1 Tax=Petroclostridium sp. X23 TaxID=3045146 RepID=UPI0024AD040B|nr:flagellar hook-basal body complex protein FliE [Petroclostridium sp. X23]WHH58929.1 flagellar hook-basal body complex protein FliE [Petroclostridium sp. X23]
MKINGINSIQPITIDTTISDTPSKKDTSFSEFLENAINQVNGLQQNAIKSNQLLAAGKAENLHQVMIDSEKAEVALQFTIQVRNKIMDAYNEIMRMPL